MVRGIAEQVTSESELHRVGAQHFQSWTATPKLFVLKITPSVVTGRRFPKFAPIMSPPTPYRSPTRRERSTARSAVSALRLSRISNRRRHRDERRGTSHCSPSTPPRTRDPILHPSSKRARLVWTSLPGTRGGLRRWNGGPRRRTRRFGARARHALWTSFLTRELSIAPRSPPRR